MSDVQAWLNSYPAKTFAAKTTVIPADTKPTHLLAITSGLLKLIDSDEQGDEVILTVATPGAIVPLPAALLSRIHSYEYVAVVETETRVIPLADLQQYLQTNPKVLSEIFSRFLRAFEVLTEQIAALKHNRAEDKIAVVLRQLEGKANQTDDASFVTVLTQQELADFAGVSRETVSRYLAKRFT